MKKHSFMESTIIATVSLVLVKILGMIYVIPFCAIVGTEGSILYAYAYNIYGLFLDISTAGIPNALGKLVNEFRTLGREEAKIRTYNIGKKLLGVIAIIAFILMFSLAPQIAGFILKDITGGSSIEDVALVIRCISFSLLIFPFLSVIRGFFQGHKYIHITSFSQVIEQFARVAFILAGSYIALKWLKLDITKVVGVAVFSAFIGGLCALIYIYNKLHKNKEEFNLDAEFPVKDSITDKEIIKKILAYAIPTVIISVSFSIYNSVDMVLILRTMNFLGFEALEVEFISTAISTWAAKISIIMTSIGAGLVSGLGPAVVEAYTLKKYGDVNRTFNRTMSLTIFVTVPMCVGISLLSTPIWSVFYGYNKIGASILAFSIFASLFSNLFAIGNYTLQSINKFKTVYISSLVGLVVNTILDVPLMLLFNKIGLPSYWGATFATIIGLLLTLIIVMSVLKKEFKFKYQEILSVIKKTIIPLLVMIIVVILLKSIISINFVNRFACIIYIAIISIIGALVYFVTSYKIGLMNQVLGDDFINKIKTKIRCKKKIKN